jgi:ribosomal protein L1
MNAITQKLPRGRNNIRSVYIKTTMGVPIKIDEF